MRSNFYRRKRPATGEPIYDIEWSLEQAEQVAIPVIRDVVARWPLEGEDKSKIGQFLALQYLRGPAFKAWQGERVEAIAAELRADPTTWGEPPAGMSHEEAVERYIDEALTSDTFRLTGMLKMVRSVATILQSMHWSLVTFEEGRLATSDHPVVVWPRSRGHSRPVANDLNAGMADTLEVFAPLAPDALLLMTWLHDEDRRELVEADSRHAATANGFVVANADEQWFHEMGVEPGIARGRRTPLSADLVGSYSVAEARRSPRRQQVLEQANAVVESEISNDPIPMVTVTRADASSAES